MLMTPPSRITATPPHLNGAESSQPKKKASRLPAAPSSPGAAWLQAASLHCRLVRESRLGGLGLDLDGTGLLLFRDLALQLDRQQAVGQLRTRDLHMVGELEAALEVTAGNAAIEVLLLVLAVRRGPILSGLAADQ